MVSVPFVQDGFVQVEFSDVSGITMNGQTLSIDFLFPGPFHANGPLWSELFLQTGPHNDPNSNGDYPYTQYVVFEAGSRASLIDESGNLLDTPTSTQGVLSTDRGWAGADMLASPQSRNIVGLHFDLVLPNTGQALVLGRIAVKADGENKGAGNPPPSPPQEYPVDNVTVTNPSPSDATIHWTTNAAQTGVEFGTTQSYGQQVSAQSTTPGEYSADLSGLASNTTYHYRITSQDANGRASTSEDYSFLTGFSIPTGGAAPRVTAGNGSLVAGFGKVQVDSGTNPSGLAIFENRQPGILVNEVAVPATPAITSGRVPIEVSGDGLLNTGIAMANPNPEDAIVHFDFRNAAGVIYRSDSFTLKGASSTCDTNNLCSHVSRFVDEFPYLSGRGIEGTLTFTSTAPVSILAVRTLYNERYDFLLANLPVSDLSISSDPQVIPQFAVGAGMKTQIVLMNPTAMTLRGRVEFLDSSGMPVLVKESARSVTFVEYSIPPNGTQRYLIEEVASATEGPVSIVPTDGNPAPVPLAILSYKPGAYTLAEASVPVTTGAAQRIYVEESSSPYIGTVVTISNATARQGTVTLSLTDLDGRIVASQTQNLEPRSMIRGSIASLIPSLTQLSFQGVLRLTTDLPGISVVGFRERYNERWPVPDFLFTSIPPVLEGDASSSRERIFPQVLNGEGFTTEIILYGGVPGNLSQGNMIFIRPDGTPSIIDIH